ncbi:MAG: leucine-rich repeat domain-containing protein [Verrucomicrobiota bacterium]
MRWLKKHNFLAIRPAKLLPLLLLLALPTALQADCFTYWTNNGTITITSYCGPGGAVTIPDSIAGLPVTTIGVSAFQGRTTLTNLTIGTNVTSIALCAFRSCSNLQSVTFPDNVTNIGVSAFNSCSSLTNVVIGNSVSSIGAYAFLHCTGLAAFNVSASNPAFTSPSGVLFNVRQRQSK